MKGEGIEELEAQHQDLVAQAENILHDHQQKMRDLYGRIEDLNQRFFTQHHEATLHAFTQTLGPRLDTNRADIDRLKSMHDRMCQMERAFALMNNQYNNALFGDQNEYNGKKNNLGMEFSADGDN